MDTPRARKRPFLTIREFVLIHRNCLKPVMEVELREKAQLIQLHWYSERIIIA